MRDPTYASPLPVEFIPPNLGLAYSQIAPLVAEAFAFLQCGDTEKAMASLGRARGIVEQVRMVVAVPSTRLTAKEHEAVVDRVGRMHGVDLS